MEFTEKSLVLKVDKFRENDLRVRILTPAHGVLNTFAFGGARSRKRFPGCLDPLSLVLFRVDSNRAGSYFALQEGSLLNGFRTLKQEPARLGAAVGCVRFAEAVVQGPEGARPVFELLAATLEALEADDADPGLFVHLFRLGVAAEQGYLPDLTVCAGCGAGMAEVDAPTLLVAKGHVLCPKCRPGAGMSGGESLRVSSGTVAALDLLGRAEPSKWGRVALSPAVRAELLRAVDQLVAYHMGLGFRDGRYVRL